MPAVALNNSASFANWDKTGESNRWATQSFSVERLAKVPRPALPLAWRIRTELNPFVYYSPVAHILSVDGSVFAAGEITVQAKNTTTLSGRIATINRVKY
jgi:hypothetical protein